MPNLFQTDWWRSFFARHWGKLWLAQALVLLVIGFAVARSFNATPDTNNTETSGAGHSEHSDAPQLWTCSMHPQIQRGGPLR